MRRNAHGATCCRLPLQAPSCKPLRTRSRSSSTSRFRQRCSLQRSAQAATGSWFGVYCCCEKLQLVFVATEVSPWSKVGGLGDVLSALPLELASRGHAVMTVTPRYKAYADVANTGLRVPVNLPSKTEESSKRQQSYDSSDSAQQNVISSQACSDGQAHARLFHQKADGVDRVFVDHPLFLNPHADLTHSNRNSSVRTYLEAADAPDLDLQYSILCQAALAAPILLWHQPQRHLASLQQQALLRSHPLTLSGGLVQHVNVDKSRISVAQAVPKHVARKLGTVVEHDRAVQPHTLRGGVAHTTAVSNHVAGQQSTRQADQQMKQWLEAGDQRDPGMYDVVWPETIGKIGFIGNDWPCAPLSLHLSCLQASCHEKLEAETIPQTVGEPNEANNMTPDNTFQTQLARLLKSARVAFCIHNMAYQGIFPQADFPRLCLPDAMQHNFMMPSSVASAQQYHQSDLKQQQQATSTSSMGHTDEDVATLGPHEPPSNGCSHLPRSWSKAQAQPSHNWMQAAVQTSHRLLTVSKAFAHELASEPEASHGLYPLLQTQDIRGITNGIDTKEWDPSTDPHLPVAARYSSSSVTKGKAAAKALFQQQHGLDQTPDTPLVAFVGWLSSQKGADVLLAALPHMLSISSIKAADGNNSSVPMGCGHVAPAVHGDAVKHSRCQIVLVGAGEHWMERCLRQISQVFPGQALGLPTFSEEAAHQVLAAADYLVVPSRFEPCGLVALYGQRYGAVPIIASVGGLKDVVTPKNGYAMGLIGQSGSSMHLRADAKLLAAAVQEALCHFGSAEYEAKQQAGMTADLSWKAPAREWEQVLAEMLA